MSENHWSNKVMFLSGVSGDKIVEEQNKINEHKTKFVVATQIEPAGTDSTGRIYDCWIYYKDQFGNVKMPEDSIQQ